MLRQVREKLRLNAAAVQLPMGSEDQLRGLVDLIDRRAFHFEGASGEQVVGECAPACLPACRCCSVLRAACAMPGASAIQARPPPLPLPHPCLRASLPPLLTPLPAEVPLPEDLKASVEAKRAELVEAVSEVDEELGEQFVLEQPIDGPMLRAAVRR